LSIQTTCDELLPRLYHSEYAKITAVLCRRFGLRQIETAQDIASETFLKAAETWPEKGIPENPAAWLYTVADNKAKDYFKHTNIFEKKIKHQVVENHPETEPDIDFTEQSMADSQLAMMFAICDPAITKEAQICLALQVLCGFSIEEISDALLSKKEAIKKRLLRAKSRLRNSNFRITKLTQNAMTQRMETVLTVLYLLFNEGYHSQSAKSHIRRELCLEAISLTLMLVDTPLTNTPQANALLSLMCFQSSRFDARTNVFGESILFQEQDKNLWDKTLIERGNYYLVEACSNETISKYHLEAGIAYWHTVSSDERKWKHILKLYNQLLLIEYSPTVALNRTFAFAKVYGNKEALTEAKKLSLDSWSYYHALLGFLYADFAPEKALIHYDTALSLSKSQAEKKTISSWIKQLSIK
jgi:RNA polymerase sigma factor (sigma-70 family)